MHYLLFIFTDVVNVQSALMISIYMIYLRQGEKYAHYVVDTDFILSAFINGLNMIRAVACVDHNKIDLNFQYLYMKKCTQY